MCNMLRCSVSDYMALGTCDIAVHDNIYVHKNLPKRGIKNDII